MRAFRLVFASVFALSILSFGLASAPRAFAESDRLYCYVNNNQSGDSESCDLILDKKVSVNGGTFVEAETAGQALNVNVGDTVTWQIKVSNNSPEDHYPTGQVTVDDVLPSGVSLNDSGVSPTTGEYNKDTGKWIFNLDFDNPEIKQDPTLTLTTTATTAGLIVNTASLSDYNLCAGVNAPEFCYGPSFAANSVNTSQDNNSDWAYIDAIKDNNSHSAYINVAVKTAPAPTTSTTAPKAPKTGFGVSQTNPLAIIAAGVGGASSLAGLGYLVRKNALQLPKIKG